MYYNNSLLKCYKLTNIYLVGQTFLSVLRSNTTKDEKDESNNHSRTDKNVYSTFCNQ